MFLSLLLCATTVLATRKVQWRGSMQQKRVATDSVQEKCTWRTVDIMATCDSREMKLLWASSREECRQKATDERIQAILWTPQSTASVDSPCVHLRCKDFFPTAPQKVDWSKTLSIDVTASQLCVLLRADAGDGRLSWEDLEAKTQTSALDPNPVVEQFNILQSCTWNTKTDKKTHTCTAHLTPGMISIPSESRHQCKAQASRIILPRLKKEQHFVAIRYIEEKIRQKTQTRQSSESSSKEDEQLVPYKSCTVLTCPEEYWQEVQMEDDHYTDFEVSECLLMG